MDFQTYIESGILELYALNQLTAEEVSEVDSLLMIHQELREELKEICHALENYARASSIAPRAALEKDLILKLDNLKKEKLMDPLDLPLINKHTKYENWRDFVSKLSEQSPFEGGRAITLLTKTETVTQVLITSKTDFDWETHVDENESFLILSGQALCTIGTHTTLMSKGNFMAIPLHIPHEVKLVSEEVTAILQRISI